MKDRGSWSKRLKTCTWPKQVGSYRVPWCDDTVPRGQLFECRGGGGEIGLGEIIVVP